MFKNLRSKQLVCFISILVFFSPVAKTQSPDPLNQSTYLIVMLKGELDGENTIGAGIIIGRKNDQVYIVTANHVVRKGTSEVQNLKVLFRHRPDQFIDAELLPDVNKDLDIAILRVEGFSTLGVDFCTLPLNRLRRIDTLKRGDKVFPTGYPNGVLWGLPVAPDLLAQIVGNEISFQSNFISEGHSGGGLLTEQGKLIGMLRSDQPPFGGAIVFEKLEQVIKEWGYPFQHRKAKSYGTTPLHVAVERADALEVKRQLDNCHIVAAQDNNGKTPLHIAAEQGLGEIARLLADTGADVNALGKLYWPHSPLHSAIATQDKEGKTPLRIALEQRSNEVAQLLVGAGANVNDFAQWCGDLLNTAPAPRASEIVQMLVDAGARVNNFAQQCGNLLHIASKQGASEIVRLLVDAGARVNDFDRRNTGSHIYDYTPLHYAAETDASEVAKILLQKGADPNKGDPTSFGVAAQHGSVSVAKLLLAAGTDEHGPSSFALAVSHGQLAMVKLLLANGQQPSGEYYHAKPLSPAITFLQNSKKPIAKAVYLRQVEIIRLLLNYEGVAKSRDASNVLYWAVDNEAIEIVNQLLESGVNPNEFGYDIWWYSNSTGHNLPLLVAVVKGNINIAKLLLEHGAEIGSATYLAVNEGNSLMVKLLIDQGGDLNKKYQGGTDIISLLHLAIKNNDVDTVKFLLAHGANPDILSQEYGTPLFMAVTNEKVALVKLLLANKANADIKHSWGHTPLSLAAKQGQKEIVHVLLKGGASVNSTESRSRPLHYAVKNQHRDIVNLLLEVGADVNVRGGEGYFPALSTAADVGDLELVKLLLEKADANTNPSNPPCCPSAWKPLHFAVANGNRAMVQLLIENEADIEHSVVIEERSRCTPLHVAVYYGFPDLVNQLLEAGANRDASGCGADTALALAINMGNDKVAAVLRR